MTTIDRHTASQDALKTLRNGKRYRLRSPRADDKQRVAECFERLSSESRRLRFFAVKKALSESELEFLTLTDGHDHIAVAAIAIDDGGVEGRMVGMARCLRLPTAPDSAELAVAVNDEVQGIGLGHLLIEALIRVAEAEGVKRFELEVLAENSGMRALTERFGGIAERQDDGILHYRVPVPPVPVVAPVEPRTAVDAPVSDAWSWLGPDAVFGAMQHEWLESTDQAFRFGQGFAEEVWQSIWDSWHPASSGRTSEPV